MIKDRAVWLTLATMAVGGVWWAAENSGDTQAALDEIGRLRGIVEAHRTALAGINKVENDIVHVRNDIERLYSEAEDREDYREVIGRMQEHLRSLDERVVRLESRSRADIGGDRHAETQLGHPQ